jgi:hypothetical protein
MAWGRHEDFQSSCRSEISVTIGRYVYPFKSLIQLSASRFYLFEQGAKEGRVQW